MANLIFIGDTHGFINDLVKQKEIINSLNPEFVLAEKMEDNILDSESKFDSFLEKKQVSNLTSFEDVEDLVRLCKDNIKLIGIDFKNFGFNQTLQDKIKKQGKLTSEEEKLMQEILEKREKNHLQKIREYSQKTSKPIVIILGSWHLREDSLIMKELKEYKVIFPSDSEGNILVEPPEQNKVIYRERIKCQKD